MANTSLERVVLIDDYLDIKTVQVDFESPSAGLRPLGENTVEKMMAAFAKLPPQVRAFRAEDLPEAFHMKGNPRIPPVWLVADEGWLVERRSYFESVKGHFSLGEHGYDPALPDMQGILMLSGPAFKDGGMVIPPVENIHLYNLFCAALHLAPAPNEGDEVRIKE
jgi:predicted AlkP superfamily pyrophosphatase or phosphodiesterase